ncbi:MAG: sugar ABC transporter ATP-binding protein [Scrofimicrobium sp.]
MTMVSEENAATEASLLVMRGITKNFGGVHAIRHADFELQSGEVHALLGENGAGKSTLMNILSGVVQPNEGSIRLKSKDVFFPNPASSQAAGIGMIHQELDLVPDATVAENLFLGREPRTRLGFIDKKRLNTDAEEFLSMIGVSLSPRAKTRLLRTGEQQMVAIAKALSENAQILVMDEPTSALSEAEVERLLELVLGLRDRGVGIIYISHRMNEISRVADRATVMRDGRTIETFDVATTPSADIITKMIGKPLAQVFPERVKPENEVVLAVRDLTVESGQSGGRSNPKAMNFDVHKGEIVGLAGLLGSGRSELLRTLYGEPDGFVSGQVTVGGKPLSLKSPRTSLSAGLAYVPEDRRIDGLVMTDSVASNLILSTLHALSRFGIRSSRLESKAVGTSIKDLGIKVSSPAIAVSALSGGNQQKVVFGRQLLGEPQVLLLDEPTRGVDIGAKAEIYRLLARLAEDGVSVLFASSELPELVGVCDRILVLQDGRIIAEFDGNEATPELLLATAGVADWVADNEKGE